MLFKRREGESLAEYRLRLAKDNPQGERPITGAVATARGVKPWHQAAFIGNSLGGKKNPKVFQNIAFDPREVFTDLPHIVKRTPQERLELMVKDLLDLAAEGYRRTGKLTLPRSMVTEITTLMWSMGLPASREKIEQMTLDHIRPYLVKYAQQTLEHVTRKGQSTDRIPEIRTTKSNQGDK